MGYCEDYPCCGHTPQDPCDYSGPTAEDMLANPARYHIGCDHEAGYCDYEDYDEDDEDDEPEEPDTEDCPEHGQVEVVATGSTTGPDPYGISYCSCGCSVMYFSADDPVWMNRDATTASVQGGFITRSGW